MTIKPLGGWRSRTAELVLLRFCPPGPLARYVSTSHCASSCGSVRRDHVARGRPLVEGGVCATGSLFFVGQAAGLPFLCQASGLPHKIRQRSSSRGSVRLVADHAIARAGAASVLATTNRAGVGIARFC